MFSGFSRFHLPVLPRLQHHFTNPKHGIRNRFLGLLSSTQPLRRQPPPVTLITTSHSLPDSSITGSIHSCRPQALHQLPSPIFQQRPASFSSPLFKSLCQFSTTPEQQPPPHKFKNKLTSVTDSATAAGLAKWFRSRWRFGQFKADRAEANRAYQQWRLEQKHHRFLLWAIGSVTGLYALMYSWNTIKQFVALWLVDIIREAVNSEKLQISASDFSKALLNDILQDEKFVGDASQWLVKVLEESKPEISTLTVDVLQSQPVLDEVKRISDSVVHYLCQQEWAQQQVAELLVAAISTEYARNGGAEWAMDILRRDDVIGQLQHVVNHSVLNEPAVQNEAAKLAKSIVGSVLRDPRTIQLAQDHLSTILNTPEFQNDACSAAWKIVQKTFAPRWLNGVTVSGIPTTPAVAVATEQQIETTDAPLSESYNNQSDGEVAPLV